MPRPLRVAFEADLHQVINRGDRPEAILEGDVDGEVFPCLKPLSSPGLAPWRTIKRKSTSTIGVLAILLLASGPAFAEIKPASPFTSHAVLQRDLPVLVWGSAEPGEAVTVAFAGQKKSATAGVDGQWRVSLDPLPASAEPRALTFSGSKSTAPVQLDDLLVGEVWLASGQSNMEFPMAKTRASWAGVKDEAEEVAAANYPQIRMFTATKTTTATPQTSVPGEWLVCTPENVPGFSAIGYFFARDLHRELKIPVGIVTVAYGASCAQAWVRREAIETVPELKAQLEQFDSKLKAYTPPNEAELAAWQEAADKAKAEGQRAPRKPGAGPARDQHNPTVCYNGMLAPIVPYAVRGVIWYQGESITDPKELFPKWNELLITDWRKLWGRELPFYFCQLAALDKGSNSPQVRAWQAEALKLPHTGMAVTIDIGDRKNVHPKNKQDVGARLARLALAHDYGRKIEASGPVVKTVTVKDGTIRVSFSHAAGLMAKDGLPKTVEIAGSDGAFVPAEAAIEGESIVVRASTVSAPTSVRYAWANYPDGANLFNAAGLPATPFQTTP